MYIIYNLIRNDDLFYYFCGPLLVYMIIGSLSLTLVYKLVLDPKNYLIFVYFYDMQIVSMLLYLNLPRYQYLFTPF